LGPRLTIALGATAAYSLCGKSVKILATRGTLLQSQLGGPVFVTVHPSSLLRQKDAAARHRDYAAFVAGLLRVKEIWLGEESSRTGG
jgi:uracil-DNA glycosylase